MPLMATLLVFTTLAIEEGRASNSKRKSAGTEPRFCCF